ncbi:MAG: Mut7-C RNAse domain-containing protein [Smithella sp.]
MKKNYPNNINYSSFEDFKFITDASLERLAKWLRLLGFNTVVFTKEAGREMLCLAAAEDRIVLTRRKDMIERQFSGRLHLITDIDIGNQLNDVIGKYSLKIDRQRMFGICLECNQKLNPVDREEVRDLVPPFVFENCTEYNRCPSCLKIYWMGTHQRNALKFMEKHIPSHLT